MSSRTTRSSKTPAEVEQGEEEFLDVMDHPEGEMELPRAAEEVDVEEPDHPGEVPQGPVEMQAEGPLPAEEQEEDMPLRMVREQPGDQLDWLEAHAQREALATLMEERRKMELEFEGRQQELIAQHRAAIDRVEEVTNQVKEVEAEKDTAWTTLQAMRSDAATAEDKLMDKNHQVELANEMLRVKHSQLADVQCDYDEYVKKMDEATNPEKPPEGVVDPPTFNAAETLVDASEGEARLPQQAAEREQLAGREGCTC